MKQLIEIGSYPEFELDCHELTIRSHIFAIWDLYYNNAAVKSELKGMDLYNIERYRTFKTSFKIYS